MLGSRGAENGRGQGYSVRDVLRAQDLQDRIHSLGLVPAYGTADELAATQATHTGFPREAVGNAEGLQGQRFVVLQFTDDLGAAQGGQGRPHTYVSKQVERYLLC